jgi:putative ABC transport system permease protein
MNLFKIAWSNVRSKPLNTSLSVMMLAFGVAVISLLLLLEKQLSTKFNRNIKDIDFVLGAKGSPMQLILANVYHVDAPTGNINIADAQRIIRNPMVKEAIPLAYGDNYEKWRIVGTTSKYPEHYGCELAAGNMFANTFEVTLGATVAAQTGLKVGDTFVSMHGYDDKTENASHAEHPFTVVGVLKPADCAIDNLILTPLESVWEVHEHEAEHAEGEEHADEHAHEEGDADHAHVAAEGADTHEHGDEAAQEPHKEKEPFPSSVADSDRAPMSPMAVMPGQEERDPHKEVTAYLIKKRNPLAAIMLANLVRDTKMQLADPAIEMNRLSQGFGIGVDALRAIAMLIMLMAFISVFISLYNSLKERRYEFALMRTMGGTRIKLFSMIQLEGLVLVLMGFAIGAAASRLGLAVLSHFLEENFHYSISEMGVSVEEMVLLGITLCVGIVASFLPAWRAMRVDISKTLSHG